MAVLPDTQALIRQYLLIDRKEKKYESLYRRTGGIGMENVQNFFRCIYGNCSECSEKTSLGCQKIGMCSFCLARFSDFCEYCKYKEE